MIEKIQNPYCL